MPSVTRPATIPKRGSFRVTPQTAPVLAACVMRERVAVPLQSRASGGAGRRSFPRESLALEQPVAGTAGGLGVGPVASFFHPIRTNRVGMR